MHSKLNTMTNFELAQQQAAEGTLQLPSVSYGTKPIDAFWYNLCVHEMQLSLFSKGIIPHRHWKITPIKQYYGLKGSNRVKLLEQFKAIKEAYASKIGIKVA